MKKGTLYWITGLSDSGKTTIANALVELLRSENQSVVLIDGDQLREVFYRREDYTIDERRSLALQYARLCRMLVDQGFIVVCATISLFKECHDWNRKNVENYNEIYINVPMEILKNRDSKGIYRRVERGEIKNVMGVDLDFDEPKNPDLIVENDGTKLPSVIAKEIYAYFRN